VACTHQAALCINLLPATYFNPCRGDIDFCFGGRQSVQEIYEACGRSGGQWAMDAVSQMLK